MTMSPAELSASPTAPTTSSALREAARYASIGAIPALCKGAYGSADPDDYAAVIGPEHVLAWGLAIIASARVIDPAVSASWPDQTWPAGRTACTVEAAHRTLTGWAEGRSERDLASLFMTASREVREAE